MKAEDGVFLMLVGSSLLTTLLLSCDKPTPLEPPPPTISRSSEQHTSNGPSDAPGFQSFNRPLVLEDYPRWPAPVQLVEAPPSDSPWTRDAQGNSQMICIDFDDDGACDVQWYGQRLDGYDWTEDAAGKMWILQHRDGEWMQYKRGEFTTVFSTRCKDCPEFEESQ